MHSFVKIRKDVFYINFNHSLGPRTFPEGTTHDYDLRQGLSDMTDWAKEFRAKFREDLDSAKATQIRATQTLDSLNGRQKDLWRSLKDMAETAVGEIGETSLLFTVIDAYSSEKGGFRILYSRDGEQRVASVSFRPKAHYVDLVFAVPGRDVPKTELDIVATNDNQVVFSGFSPETIVSYILSQLIG